MTRVRRGMIYFHFDAQDRVDAYVHRALHSLRPYADLMVVVSNSALSGRDRADLAEYCDDVLLRPNTDMDVGAYRDAMRHIGWDRLGELDELVMMNHTFFAPVRPWAPVFDTAEAWTEIGFWGLTEHGPQRPHPFLARRELSRHLQSHWIAVRRRLLVDPEFRRYWESMPAITSYRASIQWHETRFTEHFTRLGFAHRAVFPWDGYGSDNPVLHSAGRLLDDGCPILKRRAFFHDPLELERHAVLGSELLRAAEDGGYPEDLILSNLSRTSMRRELIANAGLTEVVQPAPRDAGDRAGAAARDAAPAEVPRGCAIVHLPHEDRVSAVLDRVRLLPPDWDVVFTTESSRVSDRLERENPAREGTWRTRMVGQTDERGHEAMLRDCADLLRVGRFALILKIHGGAVPGADPLSRDLVRRHVLDSLLASTAHLRAILELFARHPGLGIVTAVPPVTGRPMVDPGEATAVEHAHDLARLMHLDVGGELDGWVGAFAGMFLARPEALADLVAGEQRAETEGGDRADQGTPDETRSAALEILMVHSAMSRGWHPRQAVASQWAGVDLGLLSYKYRAVSERLPTWSDEQVRFLAARSGPEAGVARALRTDLIRRYPHLGATLQPPYRWVRSLPGTLRSWAGRQR